MPSLASTMWVSRLPSGSATKLAVKLPSPSVLACTVRGAKFSSGSLIVTAIAASAAKPLPCSSTVSAAW